MLKAKYEKPNFLSNNKLKSHFFSERQKNIFMSIAKQNPAKNYKEYISKDKNTNKISGFGQLTKRSSSASSIKTNNHTLVNYSRPKSNNEANSIETN